MAVSTRHTQHRVSTLVPRDEPQAALLPAKGDWRKGLPVLVGRLVTMRELRLTDAVSLCSVLTTAEVARSISPSPSSVEEFERFIGWALQQRETGAGLCYAVVAEDSDEAIGIFQLRRLDASFSTAEWGFAIGSDFWGTGVFPESANLVMQFAFEVMGVHRLEARAGAWNGRGNGALKKIGAVHEGVLRRSYLRDGQYFDQILWTVLDEDWKRSRSA